MSVQSSSTVYYPCVCQCINVKVCEAHGQARLSNLDAVRVAFSVGPGDVNLHDDHVYDATESHNGNHVMIPRCVDNLPASGVTGSPAAPVMFRLRTAFVTRPYPFVQYGTIS